MHQSERAQLSSLSIEDLARARRYTCNSRKSGLGKNIYLCFRAERRRNSPLYSFQECEVVPYSSYVKEGYVLTKQGKDTAKVNTSICRFKEGSNTQPCLTTQKEPPLKQFSLFSRFSSYAFTESRIYADF